MRGESLPATEPVPREDRPKELADFSAVYREYNQRVFAYLWLRTGRWEDAADLTQQVFLDVWQGLPRFRGGQTELPAWIFRIARNKHIDLLRRKRLATQLDLLHSAAELVADADIEGEIIRRDDLLRLQQLVFGLDRQQRELLALKFAANLTAREISAITGKSLAATQKQLTRLVQQLKERWYAQL